MDTEYGLVMKMEYQLCQKGKGTYARKRLEVATVRKKAPKEICLMAS